MDAHHDRPMSVDSTSHMSTDGHDDDRGRLVPVMLFGIVSVAFVLYLAIGSVEARIWRFGRLNLEERSIREVWGYMGDQLPSMPGQPVFTILFWVSLAIMVVGTIIGLWLFLSTADEDPGHERHSHGTGTSIQNG